MRGLAILMFVVGSLANDVIAYAQQTSVRTPVMNSSDSFFEQFGITWSMRGNGWFFNGPGLAPPPFGGFDPNAGLQGGFGFGGGGMSGRLNFYAGQGSSSGF